MNTKDECICGELKSAHFESTGKCAKITCHCTGYDAKPPFFLPRFEAGEDKTWQHLLGELTYEVASVSDRVDVVRRDSVTQLELEALRENISQELVRQRGLMVQGHDRFDEELNRHNSCIGHLEDGAKELSQAITEIRNQLPDFKLTRKAKKGKK